MNQRHFGGNRFIKWIGLFIDLLSCNQGLIVADGLTLKVLLTLPDTAPISRTGSPKSTFEYFCVSVLNLPHFAPQILRFLGHFCTYLVTDKDYFVITMMNANFDGMHFR